MRRSTLITDADISRLRALLRRLRASGRNRPGHLAELERRIATASAISPEQAPGDLVTMNSRVALRDIDSGKRLVLTLADPCDITAFGDRLSVAGPCGVAVLGQRVGRVVNWTLGAKVRRLRIERVLYQPEAAGDYHL